MFRTAMKTGRAIHRRCRNLPANRMIERLQAAPSPRTALVGSGAFMALYATASVIASAVVEAGGPGWLNLFIVCWVWNTMKFVALAGWRLLDSGIALVRRSVPSAVVRS